VQLVASRTLDDGERCHWDGCGGDAPIGWVFDDDDDNHHADDDDEGACCPIVEAFGWKWWTRRGCVGIMASVRKEETRIASQQGGPGALRRHEAARIWQLCKRTTSDEPEPITTYHARTIAFTRHSNSPRIPYHVLSSL
jgi:hypothetical protein